MAECEHPLAPLRPVPEDAQETWADRIESERFKMIGKLLVQANEMMGESRCAATSCVGLGIFVLTMTVSSDAPDDDSVLELQGHLCPGHSRTLDTLDGVLNTNDMLDWVEFTLDESRMTTTER